MNIKRLKEWFWLLRLGKPIWIGQAVFDDVKRKITKRRRAREPKRFVFSFSLMVRKVQSVQEGQKGCVGKSKVKATSREQNRKGRVEATSELRT